jgi:hypothetical protein
VLNVQHDGFRGLERLEDMHYSHAAAIRSFENMRIRKW